MRKRKERHPFTLQSAVTRCKNQCADNLLRPEGAANGSSLYLAILLRPVSPPTPVGLPCSQHSTNALKNLEIRKRENARSFLEIDAVDDEFKRPRSCRKHVLERRQSSPPDCAAPAVTLLNSGRPESMPRAFDGGRCSAIQAEERPPCAVARLNSSRRNRRIAERSSPSGASFVRRPTHSIWWLNFNM